jgi:hypothetical protein
MGRAIHTYRELDVIAIPDDVPALGIEAGATGVVDRVYDEGRKVHVEAIRDGETVGFVTIAPDPEPHVVAHYDVADD